MLVCPRPWLSVHVEEIDLNSRLVEEIQPYMNVPNLAFFDDDPEADLFDTASPSLFLAFLSDDIFEFNSLFLNVRIFCLSFQMIRLPVYRHARRFLLSLVSLFGHVYLL